MKLVIFGSDGFIGREIVKLAPTSGVEIFAYSRSKYGQFESDKISSLVSSFCSSTDELNVIYCAGPAPIKTLEQMIESRTILQIVLKSLSTTFSRVHFVYVSSDAVYGSTGENLNESSNLSPDSLHGFLHAHNENLVLSKFGSNATTLVRPVALFGVGDPHNSYGPNRFFRDASSSRIINLVNGGIDQRDHLWITDAAQALIKISESPRGVVNLATGRAKTFLQVAQEVASIFQENVQIEFLSEGKVKTLKTFNTLYLQSILCGNLFDSLERGINSWKTSGGEQ